MTESEANREWSQDELRAHLISEGMDEAARLFKIIPQHVKFTGKAPLTAEDLSWAREMIAKHPEWSE